MTLHGTGIVGTEVVPAAQKTFTAFNPKLGQTLQPPFHEATEAQVDQALELAVAATEQLRNAGGEKIASFLLAIAAEIEALGDALIERASEETGLDLERLRGERARTLNQIKLFASLAEEGSWVDARIDPAIPDRKPLPRVDIRRMLQPIGPVAVFGASNFPLAFSVAGGDTISAFAAKNPVVVKGHPAHPGTSEMVASAIMRAVRSQGLHEGVFSMLQSTDPKISIALVTHPKTKAVGFTGSLRAGRALFDAAAKRPSPIPVYAEMGSVNPVFILPGALKTEGQKLADGLYKSVMLGTGQFCTSPGLVFVQNGEGVEEFRSALGEFFTNATPGTMLNAPIAKGYAEKLEAFKKVSGVQNFTATKTPSKQCAEGQPAVLVTDFRTWLSNHLLHEENFGPATLIVQCASAAEVIEAAQSLDGSLTATIHGTAEELPRHARLIDLLTCIAGRILFNGFPTGVEVGYAMHHGGPYPATTDEKFTSVGTAAIYRFAKPVCYQNFPDNMLPPELQNANPRNMLRAVNGKPTRDSIQ
jgi:NADP-dependent aldehyde dehydrogenase